MVISHINKNLSLLIKIITIWIFSIGPSSLGKIKIKMVISNINKNICLRFKMIINFFMAENSPQKKKKGYPQRQKIPCDEFLSLEKNQKHKW